MKLEGLKIKGSKRIKKPDFKLIFVKVFAVVLIIAMAISFALAGELAEYERKVLGNSDSDVFYYLDKAAGCLEENSIEDMDYEQCANFSTACACLSVISWGPVSVKLDGQEIYNTENSVIGRVRIEGVPAYLECVKIDPTDAEKCQKLNDYAAKNNAFFLLGFRHQTTYYLEADYEAYANYETREFYPTRINVVADTEWGGFDTTTSSSNKCIDTIDLTPSDKTLVEGMELVTWEKYDDRFWSDITAKVAIMQVNGKLDKQNNAEERITTFTSGDGTVHELSVLYNTTIADQIGNMITRIYIINVLLAVILLSLIISVILYFRAKSVFDVFEYRRKTTEAMAHDLKTPLAITSVYVDNLKESLENDKDRCQYHAEQIEDSVKYLNSLVNNILEYSNSQREDKIFAKEEIDVRKEIDEYVAKVKPTADTKGIKIKVDGADSRKTDKNLWNQSIANLIDNAIKHGAAKGEITITIAKNLVEITNTVESDIADPMRLTEPFVKGTEERGENTGSGLGLAIAKNNIERLGFKFVVTCQDKKFTVRIK